MNKVAFIAGYLGLLVKESKLNPNASKRSKYQRKYNSKPQSKKDRASRNTARRQAIAKNGKTKLYGKDVHHIDGNPQNNAPGNRRIKNIKQNRSER